MLFKTVKWKSTDCVLIQFIPYVDNSFAEEVLVQFEICFSSTSTNDLWSNQVMKSKKNVLKRTEDNPYTIL